MRSLYVHPELETAVEAIPTEDTQRPGKELEARNDDLGGKEEIWTPEIDRGSPYPVISPAGSGRLTGSADGQDEQGKDLQGTKTLTRHVSDQSRGRVCNLDKFVE